MLVFISSPAAALFYYEENCRTPLATGILEQSRSSSLVTSGTENKTGGSRLKERVPPENFANEPGILPERGGGATFSGRKGSAAKESSLANRWSNSF